MQLKSPPRRFSKKVSPAEEASIETPVARKDAMFHNSKKTGRLKYGGREPTLDRKKVLALQAEGKTPSQIARELKIARSSVYRLLADSKPVTLACAA